MSIQTPEWQALEQRLGRLERETRWWKALAGTLFALQGLLLLTGATLEGGARTFDEVRAGQFVLVDAKGNPRAGLRVGADGSTALALAGPDGRPLAGLSVLPGGSARLQFYDKDGKGMGGVGIQHDGSIGLALAERDGTLHLWTGGTEIHQITPGKGQRVWKPITTFTARSVSPEDYRPVDAELLSRAEGGPR